MIDDLNQVPPELVEEARRRSGFERHAFLWSRLTPPNRAFIDWFIQDVVEGGADVASWGRGRILVPELGLDELLARSAGEVVAPLGGPGDAGWSRIEIDDAYAFPHRHAGAPAAVHTDLGYRWSPPPGVAGIVLGSAPLHPLSRIDVAVRRWMACRMAVRAAQRLPLLTSVAEAGAVLAIQVERISSDARRALEGLIAEVASRADGGPAPGFRGPDSLYE